MTKEPEKRPSASEALTHYWILNRFIDLKADNLLLDEETNDSEEIKEFNHLGKAQSNMAHLKL